MNDRIQNRATPIKLTYANGEVTTRGPAGFSALLSRGVTQELVWETIDRRALDLELQIQVLQLNSLPADQLSQFLRWQVWSLGHGTNSYDYPPTVSASAFGPIARFPNWPIPARGVRERFSGRVVRIVLGLTPGAPAAARPMIQASMQPVGDSSGMTAFPLADLSASGSTGRGYFPMGAREWRVSLFNITAGEQLAYVDWAGTVLGGVALLPTDVADWTPIPLNAASWVPSLGEVEAVYR